MNVLGRTGKYAIMGHYHKMQGVISYDNTENSGNDKNPLLKDNTYNPEIIFLDRNTEIDIPQKYDNKILADLQEAIYECGRDRTKQIEYVARMNDITMDEVAEYISNMQEYMKKSGLAKEDKNGMWMLR